MPEYAMAWSVGVTTLTEQLLNLVKTYKTIPRL